MQLINQIITTFSLIAGVLLGEHLSNKVFGISKKWFVNIIEILIFITLLISLFNNFLITEQNNFIIYGLNFLFGITSITITRGLTTGVGHYASKIKDQRNPLSSINEQTIIIGLTRNLLNKGLSKQEINELLVNSGFNNKRTNKTINRIELNKKEVKRT